VRPGIGIQDGVVEADVEVVEHFGICEGEDGAGGTVAPGFHVALFALELLAVLGEAVLAKRACARAAEPLSDWRLF
jgi:hypothetical protein